MIRYGVALCTLALLVGAPRVEAQEGCSWERVRARRGSEARRDSLWDAARDAYRANVLRAAAGAGIAEPRGVAFFSMEPDGSAPVVRALDANVPEALLTPMIADLTERMKQLPRGPRGRVALFARLDTLPLPGLREDGKRLKCAPRILNGVDLQRMMSETVDRNRGAFRTLDTQPAMLTVIMGRGGQVLHAELQRSSGTPGLDQLALDLAAQFIIRPASEDGVGQDVIAALPVRLFGNPGWGGPPAGLRSSHPFNPPPP